VPVPGAAAITCLISVSEDAIWGIADGNLFVFNPTTKKSLVYKSCMTIRHWEATFGEVLFWLSIPTDRFMEQITVHCLK
ncbi:MAG: hypothetical protein ACQUHE_07475, partial [Bacteroidia bacterium]